MVKLLGELLAGREWSHALTDRICSLMGPPPSPPLLLHRGGTIIFIVTLEPAQPLASSGILEKPRGNSGSPAAPSRTAASLDQDESGATPAP